jgi:dolichol-phosphate mannosyltransferase
MNRTYNWEVPTFKVEFDKAITQNFCIVIPVINEGKRIHSLLLKMREKGIHLIANIIIVDGGSTDGSLQKSILDDYNVHTLLTKTDKGKLSAQLRCAYSFAMEKGYIGVVTIDGNDKDDPKDIPRFIELIMSGYDFVQASRFVPGGYGENTPKIRDLAIRIIHAPLLSVSSGFKWTDTTQGFRGYSAKLITSEKLKIFRKEFPDYELLAYLNYASPRYGFKCIELGTSRVYPKGEVPTKISSFRGNWNLLKTLWKVCNGYYK